MKKNKKVKRRRGKACKRCESTFLHQLGESEPLESLAYSYPVIFYSE